MSQLAMPPTGATYFLGDEALTLFLEYRYLPADQLARILSAVAGLNQAVLTAIRDFQWQQGDLRLRPELYITSVRTGESIDIKFRPGIFVFSVKFTKDGDVRIE